MAAMRASLPPLSLTYDDLEMPQDLSHAQRMAAYARSKLPLQRLVCATSLDKDPGLVLEWDAIRLLGEDSNPSVREALASKLGVILLKPTDRSGNVLKLCTRLACDEIEVVRTAAINSLSEASEKLVSVVADLFPIAIVASRSLDSNVRLTSIPLVVALGKRDVGFALALLTSLQGDVRFSIRKQATLGMGKLAPCLTDAASAQRAFSLLPSLSQDVTWPVRKAAVETFAAACGNAHVKASVVEVLHTCVIQMVHQDASRWVRTAAYWVLGPLIAALRPGVKDDVLISAYVDVDMETESCRHAFAYNLPGVLVASPDSRWTRVRGCFLIMVADSSVSVRKSLASGLGVVASLLSESVVDKDILPALLELLNASDDDHGYVRQAAVRQAAAVMSRASSGKRSSVFGALIRLRQQSMVSATPARDIRLALAEQLDKLADVKVALLADEALVLCQDDVHAVRLTACSSVGKVLGEASTMEQFQGLNLLSTWAEDKGYLCRYVFALAAKSCLSSPKCRAAAQGKLVPLLKRLESDKVQTVRIAAQEALQCLPS